MSVAPPTITPMDVDMLVGELGVKVVNGRLPEGWWGAYRKADHTITMRPRIGPLQYRSTIMHELGHAWYQHDGSTPRAEREASMWAARRLITARAFIDACRTEDTAHGIAHILGVLPRDVQNYVAQLSVSERMILSKILKH